MKKRLICIVLSITLLFCLGVTGCAKSNKSGTVISIGSAKAKVGESVKIPVEISGNPGILAWNIVFKFDSEVLEYVGYDQGDLFSDYMAFEKAGQVGVNCIENEDIKGDGKLITLEFKVIGDDIKKTQIAVDMEKSSICNNNEELITFTDENGTVKIK